MWGTIAGSAGSLFGMATQGENERRQLRQQEKLNELQEGSNRRLMKDSYTEQMKMYNHTFEKNTPIEQRKNLEAAGINPALMYNLGGQGGTTAGSGGASIGGATAADAASSSAAQSKQFGMGLESAMTLSQIALNQSQAKKNEEEANNLKEQSTTTKDSREILIENMKQEGLGRFLRNMEEDYKQNQSRNSAGSSEVFNETYQWVSRIENDSYVREGIVAAIENTLADTGNKAAQELKNNKEASAIFEKLQIEMLKAKAQGKQAENGETMALAFKLAAEFETGEFTNWKTWTNLGMEGVSAIGNVVGKVSPKGLIKEPAKALLNSKPVTGFR